MELVLFEPSRPHKPRYESPSIKCGFRCESSAWSPVRRELLGSNWTQNLLYRSETAAATGKAALDPNFVSPRIHWTNASARLQATVRQMCRGVHKPASFSRFTGTV